MRAPGERELALRDASAPVPELASSPRARRQALLQGLRVIPDSARGMGLTMWAPKGAGKSRTLGRLIAFQDFRRFVPLVVVDPIGGTIDNFLDKINRQPEANRQELLERVRYVNMAGQDGFVTPWPIYYQLFEGERLGSVARRFVDIIERADPALSRASIQGLNALSPLAQAAGIVLAALDLGITEAWSVLHEPGLWEERLLELAGEQPETAEAVGQLRALYKLRETDKANRLAALDSKLTLFRFFPAFQAIFGATTPGINWEEVVEKRQAVLLDFRDIVTPEHKRFCLLWIYNSFLTYVKKRGHGRHTPISFIIDELRYLVGSAADNTDLLSADLDELINRIARSHALWLTIAGQELFQLPEQIRQTVLSMGIVLLGQTSDKKTAEELARRYFPYDPYKVKKTDPVRGVTQDGAPGWWGHIGTPAVHGIVGYRTTEFTRDEQNDMHSREFLNLEPFRFLFGRSEREGALPTELVPVSIERLDPGQYLDKATIDALRAELTRRDSVMEADILKDIALRFPRASAKQPENRQSKAVPGSITRRSGKPLARP